MTEPILVTGAFGLVGSTLVRHLIAEGRPVVATDLDVPRNRAKARRLARSAHVDVRWTELTDAGAVAALVSSVKPGAIVHLAALIPPFCYASSNLARRVNVEATAALVRAASLLPVPPRFVLASSVAVYGARNPHRCPELLSAATPVHPCDLYGAHKVEAEQVVTSSDVDWVILRLGGVLSAEPRWDVDLDMIYLASVLPVDGRIQTVDVRDVARAFSAATTTEMTREAFLIGGDESHRVVQGTLGSAMAEAMGLVDGVPPGRPGDPASDGDWFATDWMDTTRAQQVLSFQHHSLPEIFAETRAKVGWKRWPLRAIAPAMRMYLRSRSPYRHAAGDYADPWGAIRSKWGDPCGRPGVVSRG